MFLLSTPFMKTITSRFTFHFSFNFKRSAKRYLSIGSLLTTLSVSPTLFATVLDASAQGFVINNTVTTPLTPDIAYNAFVNHVDTWWPKDHTWWKGTLSINAKAQGCFCESKGDASAMHMMVSYVEPHKKVVMIGGLGPLQEMGLSGTLVWTFSPITMNEDASDKPSTPEVTGTSINLRYTVNGVVRDIDGEKLASIVDSVQLQQLTALSEFVPST